MSGLSPNQWQKDEAKNSFVRADIIFIALRSGNIIQIHCKTDVTLNDEVPNEVRKVKGLDPSFLRCVSDA